MSCLENWFRYRMPGASKAIGGASRHTVGGLAEGFAVAPFLNPEAGLMTIPDEYPLLEEYVVPRECSLPEATTREEHRREVKMIVESLHGDTGKTVASRAIRVAGRIRLADTFQNLCEAYPKAFVFMFSTPATGTWIGASPELLLRMDGDRIHTMSLAGTRPAGQGGEWDIKNREEQQMVTDYIRDTLTSRCGSAECGKPYTREAGTVEHICTDITAPLPGTALLKDILCELSPTPALCGSDRTESMRIIKKGERHDREMYGGFCGPCGLDGETAMFVNLRSAKCSPDAICVYAGGGITRLSDPDSEWHETEIKSQTIINKLKTSEV